MPRLIQLKAKLNQPLRRFASFLAAHLRNRYLVIWDILAQPLVVLCAFALRLEGLSLGFFWHGAFNYILLSVIVLVTVFYAVGMYRRFWRYASLDEVVLIIIGSLLATLISASIFFLLLVPARFTPSIPRSIPGISFLLLVLATAIPRYAIRLGTVYRIRVGHNPPAASTPIKVLIVGAGDAGIMVLREMLVNPQLGYAPVGFVDDDLSKQGLEIMSCRVMGTTKVIPDLVQGII
ncbi:MAG: nucleoside-diphosphate sugar epimerase/dehydratase [Armatimonadota bacterium]